MTFEINTPIRLASGRSLLSGGVPDFELQRGEDGRAIDTQQIFSGGGINFTPLFGALNVQRHNPRFDRRRIFAAFESAR